MSQSYARWWPQMIETVALGTSCEEPAMTCTQCGHWVNYSEGVVLAVVMSEAASHWMAEHSPHLALKVEDPFFLHELGEVVHQVYDHQLMTWRRASSEEITAWQDYLEHRWERSERPEPAVSRVVYATGHYASDPDQQVRVFLHRRAVEVLKLSDGVIKIGRGMESDYQGVRGTFA